MKMRYSFLLLSFFYLIACQDKVETIDIPVVNFGNDCKESLLDRFYQSEDEELAEAVIEKLYQFCYGIELKKYYEYEKEKVSISD